MDIHVDDDFALDVQRYWNDLTPIMVCEEASEMIKAISKLERFYKKVENEPWDDQKGWGVLLNDEENSLLKKLESEIADLFIIISALSWKYGFDEVQIKKFIDKKMNKKY